MNILQRVKQLTNERKMSIAELERKLDFSSGSISRWDKQSPSSERIQKVADFFDVTTDYLLGRTEFRRLSSDGLTVKEDNDIKKRLEKIRDDLKNNTGELILVDGDPLSDESIESILSAVEFAEKQSILINKQFTAKKKKPETID